MRTFVAVAAALALVGSQTVLATDPSCTHTFADGHAFDLSAAHGAKDYAFTIKGNMVMNANICGNAATTCYPATWTNPVSAGPAIQMWGAAPSCNPPACKDASGKAICCTANCQVIGETTSVAWTYLDATNPAAGVSLTYAGVPASDSDPFWCPYNATSGTQNDRVATYNIACDASADPATLVSVSQNGMSGCHWTFEWKSKHACPTSTKSLRA